MSDVLLVDGLPEENLCFFLLREFNDKSVVISAKVSISGSMSENVRFISIGDGILLCGSSVITGNLDDLIGVVEVAEIRDHININGKTYLF